MGGGAAGRSWAQLELTDALVHGFGKKIEMFAVLFLCKIYREKEFYDILDRKTIRFRL